jgi:hypothetical protein
VSREVLTYTYNRGQGTGKRPIQSGKANPPRDIMTSRSHQGFKGATWGSGWVSF